MASAQTIGGALRAPWRIGVDIGGTFTDLVLADDAGATGVAKVPSVSADPSRGVFDALERLASDLHTSVAELLNRCGLFVHGSTVATNTMLEGTGAKVGLLSTRGFRDALELRRGLREDQWNHREPYAPVLVPRFLRHAVDGRIGADGTEIEPLAGADVEAGVRGFEAEGVEAIAIALFNSFLDPRHEVEAEALVRARWGGRWVTRSAAISPTMGEYERTSTAVVNAYLSPRTVDYLQALDDTLRARPQTSAPAAAVERRRRFRRSGRASAGEHPAERPGRRGRSARPLPESGGRGRPRGCRQSHLDGDWRHLV